MKAPTAEEFLHKGGLTEQSVPCGEKDHVNASIEDVVSAMELYHASEIAKAGDLPDIESEYKKLKDDGHYELATPQSDAYWRDGAEHFKKLASAALASCDAEIEKLKAEGEEKDREIERLNRVGSNRWQQGYFCAVSMLLEKDGGAKTQTRELGNDISIYTK